MTDTKQTPPTEFKLPDPVKLMQNLAKVFERASAIARQVAERPDLQKQEAETQILPMEQVAKTLGEVFKHYSEDPAARPLVVQSPKHAQTPLQGSASASQGLEA